MSEVRQPRATDAWQGEQSKNASGAGWWELPLHVKVGQHVGKHLETENQSKTPTNKVVVKLFFSFEDRFTSSRETHLQY